MMVLAAAAGDIGEAGFQPVALVVGVVLLLLNGYFVAAEIALLAARRARVEGSVHARDGGDLGRSVAVVEGEG